MQFVPYFYIATNLSSTFPIFLKKFIRVSKFDFIFKKKLNYKTYIQMNSIIFDI